MARDLCKHDFWRPTLAVSWDVGREGSASSGHHCGTSKTEATGLLLGPNLSSGQIPSHHQHHAPQPAGALTIPATLNVPAQQPIIESCSVLIMQVLARTKFLAILGQKSCLVLIAANAVCLTNPDIKWP